MKSISSRREIVVKDWSFVWETKARRQAISIILKPGKKLKVISPKSISLQSVVGFLEEKREWIETQSKKLESHVLRTKKRFVANEVFLFQGRKLKLIILPTPLTSYFIRIEDEQLMLYAPVGQVPSEDFIRDLLVDYYEKQGREKVLRRANELQYFFKMNGIDLPVKRFSLRGQTGRWGSCTSTGVISLNWKLVAFSELAIDYVICHELAHLKHMNHSASFWKFVEQLCPNFRDAKKEIRHHAHEVDFLR